MWMLTTNSIQVVEKFGDKYKRKASTTYKKDVNLIGWSIMNKKMYKLVRNTHDYLEDIPPNEDNIYFEYYNDTI